MGQWSHTERAQLPLVNSTTDSESGKVRMKYRHKCFHSEFRAIVYVSSSLTEERLDLAIIAMRAQTCWCMYTIFLSHFLYILQSASKCQHLDCPYNNNFTITPHSRQLSIPLLNKKQHTDNCRTEYLFFMSNVTTCVCW